LLSKINNENSRNLRDVISSLEDNKIIKRLHKLHVLNSHVDETQLNDGDNIDVSSILLGINQF